MGRMGEDSMDIWVSEGTAMYGWMNGWAKKWIGLNIKEDRLMMG